ncbi:TetR/AcrR family transcriptional regulator [Shewanella oneidensis MR-1]|uniref:Transcriptional repressor of N-ethylmaleimide reductase NemR n=1 Tax=Shewanella oneidensis (strain ATCC 700550 / JCM 31522 / CIP 106686 / LMG 19005 / NCIMB 14063 / MR-1) TaxID=211586 RepID=Q8E926_SHEON|nr:TetR/AcrR family transcriptional regulator [Shewanella oneidensis]AAN57433.1 transcriptional repressor of N-ethylmaleimide reductase NemR [Shewanella oneidensis MR-1]MDX5998269.1 TetR/AcrR family transcriptional regulator [Shewanella oneidensis]MEE2029043.1 HTH-type transcriptional repressor NemR [Shewanella oneidensis]QKG94751.1 TetR/AcrR family transcriptional regulator [Shewanella oneidensis MR-1]
MKTETQSTRQHILDIGYSLIIKQGFSCLGLAQLLKAAEVPKGSFYHYFKSKEQFGEALLTGYFEQYQVELDSLFANPQLSGFDRQMQYWQKWLHVQQDGCIDQKCLVVKLSAEVADLSEAMRLVLLKGSAGIIERLTHCIQDGIEDSSICNQDAQATAELLYHMWLGASLMNKLGHSHVALTRALVTTESILKHKTVC